MMPPLTAPTTRRTRQIRTRLGQLCREDRRGTPDQIAQARQAYAHSRLLEWLAALTDPARGPIVPFTDEQVADIVSHLVAAGKGNR